ncbi:MAG: serine/threonine-protein phosphatase [Solirubrobacterales bacterium]|nr:serine/threonine-protein phosphatase [Solirubrobacterales bacterium]
MREDAAVPAPSPQPLDLAALLAAVEAAPPVAAAEVVGEQLRQALGARDVSFLIADYGGQSLIRLSHVERDNGRTGRERRDTLAIAGTPYGRALSEQDVQVVSEDDECRVYAPVTSRGESVGVLELLLGFPPGPEALASIAVAAHALAYVIIAGRRFTDLFEWGQRSLPLSLEAEIQHRLLPGSYTCEGGQFTLAGWLEPAGDVGGDTFDFSVERDTLHLSMSDAMGHTLDAALLATVFVGALRNARRGGVTLQEQAHRAHQALCAYAGSGAFVTGQVARVDLRTGLARLVNAGHPAPVLVRAGESAQVRLEIDPPFGVWTQTAHRVQEFALRPGDRLVFLTDGMLERNADSVDAAGILARSRDLHPREAVQDLVRRVVEACGGELRDDATVLCLDWHGPGEERDSSGGADG